MYLYHFTYATCVLVMCATVSQSASESRPSAPVPISGQQPLDTAGRLPSSARHAHVMDLLSLRMARDSTVKKLVAGNNTFSWDLYRELILNDSGNVFYSPYSISSALAMVYAGAAGATRSQISRALGLSLKQEEVDTAIEYTRKLYAAIDTYGSIRLRTAHSVWVQQEQPLLPAYRTRLVDRYGVELEHVDFALGEEVRRRINAWVDKNTEGRIQNVVPRGGVDGATSMVLVNAIYFLAQWAHRFDSSATRRMPFYRQGHDSAMVWMMYREGGYTYGEDRLMQIVKLPYVGIDPGNPNGHRILEMQIILPRSIRALREIERTPHETIENVLQAARIRTVYLYLPRFTMTLDYHLGDNLRRLGICDAFAMMEADFSGMSGTRALFISGIWHKAFVEVNERGTEAAAATVIRMGTRGIGSPAKPLPPVTVRVDRPFLFRIVDSHTGMVLFVGRVMQPTRVDS